MIDSDLSDYNTAAALDEAHGVYLLQHRLTGELCVKKTLRVFNEQVYRTLQSAKCPGLPAIYEIRKCGDTLVVREEYIEGVSLRTLIDAGDLTESSAKRILSELCGILDRLHNSEPPIVHRDIKPSNILIRKNGDVVLLDFNAAKFTVPGEETDTVLLGTKGYAAPEQYGFGASTPQTDIYALGVLIREMNRALPEPSESFSRAADRCTQLDPKHRYNSASEVRDELEGRKHFLTEKRIKEFRTFLPPGFRTGKLWKMLPAMLVYGFCGILFLTLEDVPGIAAPGQWIVRIGMCVIFLTFVGLLFNYRGVWRRFPLAGSPHLIVRVLGGIFPVIGIPTAMGCLMILILMLPPFRP